MLKNWLIVAQRARARSMCEGTKFLLCCGSCHPPSSSLPHPPPSSACCAVLFASERNHSCRNICKHLFLTPPHSAGSVCVQCVCVCVRVCVCVCACWKLSRLALKSFFANIATARSLQAICHWNSWTCCCCCFFSVVVVVAAAVLLLPKQRLENALIYQYVSCCITINVTPQTSFSPTLARRTHHHPFLTVRTCRQRQQPPLFPSPLAKLNAKLRKRQMRFN